MSVDTETEAAPITDRVAQLEQRVRLLIEDLTEARRQRGVAEMELTKFKERVVSVGEEAAEAHDWCHVYDDLMSELGLPGRQKEHLVAVRVRYTQMCSVQARSQQEAEDLVEGAYVYPDWAPVSPFGRNDELIALPGRVADVEVDIAEQPRA